MAFAPELSPLPAGFTSLSKDERARVLLANKADDTEQYKLLRAQALRCTK